MLETFVTLVFLVAGLQDGMALLDPSAARLVRPGDAAVIYRLERASEAGASAERWAEVGRGRVVESGQGPAVVWSSPAGAEAASLRVALRVPEDRITTPEQSFEQAGAALVAVEDSDLLSAVDQIIPDNERVELAVLAILDQRWRIRDAQSGADGTGSSAIGEETDETPPSGAHPLASIPKAQVGENDLIPVRVEVTPVDPALVDSGLADAGWADAAPGGSAGSARPSRQVAELPGNEPPATTGITSRVHAWAQARAAGSLDEVLAFYARGFEPADGLNRGDWAENLRMALAASGQLTVRLVDMKAGLYGSTDRARVLFTEQMTVNGVARAPQRVRLILVWDEHDWFILEESTLSESDS